MLAHQQIAQESSSPGASRRGGTGLALAVIAIAQLMVVLDISIVNVALPSIQRSLHFSPTSLEWVVNAYALAFGGLLLLGGRLGDHFGRRRMFIAGIALLMVASLLGGLATGQAWLITARAAQGVGGAIVSPTALALIASTFGEGGERNRAMGVYAAMSGAGGAIGNLLGGVFTDINWRWVLFVNVPIGLFVVLLAPRTLPESRTHGTSLDLPGGLTATAGMTSLVYGLVHAATHPWGSAGTAVPLAAGAALLVAFVGVEARARNPLMPLRIFASRNRSGAYAIMFAIGSALFAMFYFLTLYMQSVTGYSPLRTGLAFLPFAVAVMVLAGVSGQVVAKLGPRALLFAGTLACAGGLAWLTQLSANAGYASSLLGPLLLVGAGIGMCFVPLTLAVLADVGDDLAGVSSALLNSGQQVGGALGLAVLGTVAATVTRNRMTAPAGAHAIGAAYTHGYAVAFAVATGVLLAAALITPVVIRVTAKSGAQTTPMPF
jgi:EmrB/QacA subfamily drug resistance transporter